MTIIVIMTQWPIRVPLGPVNAFAWRHAGVAAGKAMERTLSRLKTNLLQNMDLVSDVLLGRIEGSLWYHHVPST